MTFQRGQQMSEYTIDLIEELKLRRWARLNRSRIKVVDDSLHPVVIDELRMIEIERHGKDKVRPKAASKLDSDFDWLEKSA